MRTALFPVILLAMLSGCAAANLPPRFDKQTVDRIEVGKSTREDVLLALGVPERTGPSGRILFYRWERSGALIIIPTVYGAPVFGSISREYLRVDFDAGGVLSKIDTGRQELSIPSDISKFGGYALASPEEGAAAKRFHADPEKCTVHLYVRRRGGDEFSSATPAFLRIDRRHVGHIGADKWYFRMRVTPGIHTATILDGAWEKTPRLAAPFAVVNEHAPGIKDELTFRCSAGSLKFVEIGYPAFTSYPALREVESEEGRAAIREGKLLIGPL